MIPVPSLAFFFLMMNDWVSLRVYVRLRLSFNDGLAPNMQAHMLYTSFSFLFIFFC